MTANLNVCAICHTGRVKPNNEDMILLNTEIFRDGKRKAVFNTNERIIIAVADGVGGLEKGEVASEQVLKSLLNILSNIPKDLSNEELRSVFETYTSETHASLPKDMGSTLVGLFFYNGKLYRYHAGDSRIYRYRRGDLERLTVDHSLRESGGQKDAPSNIITNSLGGGSSAFIDFSEIEYPFLNNDIYLLSSDGMHDLVPQKEIAAILEKSGGKTDKAAEKLIDISNNYGGKDNISVIAIQITIKER